MEECHNTLSYNTTISEHEVNTWTINEPHLPGKCKQCFTKLSTVEDTFLGTGRWGDWEIGDWEIRGLGDWVTGRWGDWEMGDGGTGRWVTGRWDDWEMGWLLSHKRKGLRWLAVFVEWCSCNAHNLCFSSYSTSYVLNLQENVLFMHMTFEEKLFLVTQI